jgi:hypothetical protein
MANDLEMPYSPSISQNYSTLAEQTIKILFRDGNGKSLRNLTAVVEKDECHYIGGGAFGDVYRGKWKDSSYTGNRPDVVIKVLRSTGSSDIRTLKKALKVLLHHPSLCYSPDNYKSLRRELVVWQSLRHKNIVPFIGIVLSSSVLPSIVSRRMPNG